jgi:amidase
MTTDWRLARSQACINGGYNYKADNGSTIKIDALLLPNMGGGSASSSFSSVVDAAQYPAVTIPVGVLLSDCMTCGSDR